MKLVLLICFCGLLASSQEASVNVSSTGIVKDGVLELRESGAVIRRIPLNSHSAGVRLFISPENERLAPSVETAPELLRLVCEFRYEPSTIDRTHGNKYSCVLRGGGAERGAEIELDRCRLNLAFNVSTCLLELVVPVSITTVSAAVQRCRAGLCINPSTGIGMTPRSPQPPLWVTTTDGSTDISLASSFPRWMPQKYGRLEVAVRIRIPDLARQKTVREAHIEILHDDTLKLVDIVSNCPGYKLEIGDLLGGSGYAVNLSRTSQPPPPSHDRTEHCFSGRSPTVVAVFRILEPSTAGILVTTSLANIHFTSETPASVNETFRKLQNDLKIPYSELSSSILVIVESPVILPSLSATATAARNQSATVRVVFRVQGSRAANNELTAKILCRPLRPETAQIACPAQMQPWEPSKSGLAWDPSDDLAWSLELMLDSWKAVVDVRPLIIPLGSWIITGRPSDDVVLNPIVNWTAPPIRENKPDKLLVKCSQMYQTVAIGLFHKVQLLEQGRAWTTILEFSGLLRPVHLVIEPSGLASAFSRGNSTLIQALKPGDLQITVKDVPLSRTPFAVTNHPVHLRKIVLACRPNSTTARRYPVASSATETVAAATHRSLQKWPCWIETTLHYSDNSELPLRLLPATQYILRLVTARRIIEPPQPEWWFTPAPLDGKTRFFLELRQSRHCGAGLPALIFRNSVDISTGDSSRLPPPAMAVSSPDSNKSATTSVTKQPPISEALSTGSIYTPTTSDDAKPAHSKVVFTVCGLLAGVLLVVGLNMLLATRLCRNRHRAAWRRSQEPSLEKKTELQRRFSLTQQPQNFNTRDFPPLLPPPGPQQPAPDTNLALASPNTFWCLDQHRPLSRPTHPFSRQFSLPLHPSTSASSTAPSSNHQIRQQQQHRRHNNESPQQKTTHSNRSTALFSPLDDGHWPSPTGGTNANDDDTVSSLNRSPIAETSELAPVTANSCTHDTSSGFGTMSTTQLEDFISDPYDCQDRYNQLSKVILPTNGTDIEYGPI